jgi:hypothetical protein
MWCTSKEAVWAQLDIPPRHDVTYPLDFSQTELINYSQVRNTHRRVMRRYYISGDCNVEIIRFVIAVLAE